MKIFTSFKTSNQTGQNQFSFSTNIFKLMFFPFMLLVLVSNASVNTQSNCAFRSAVTGSVKVNLSKGSPLSLIDGVLSLYNNSFNASEDAVKMWGNEENIAIVRNGKYLSLEARQEIVAADTTFLYMSKLISNTTYTFTITGTDMSVMISGYLKDKYLNSETPLDLTTDNNIVINTDTSVASKATDRFMIIYNYKPLSVNNIQIKALLKDKSVSINWKASTEQDVDHYEIERSINSTFYKKIESATALNIANSAYSFIDNNAVTGNNYYRIKVVSKDGSIQYSSITKIAVGDVKATISLYPNPIVNKQVNLMMNNVAAGNYNISLYNTNGQQVMVQSIQHPGGTANISLQLPGSISAGMYQLRFSGKDNNFTQSVIVK